MRVLLCGHRSFAARGLIDGLRAAGHDVTAYTRGPVGVRPAAEAFAAGDPAATGEAAVTVVTGPALAIDENPHLAGPFDAVVNYVLLKDEPVGPNVAFTAALLRLCQRVSAGHLVHVSSISSCKANVRVVTEDAPIEEVPERKGSYGSLKVATDQHLLASRPAGLKMTLLRPGFILGPGLGNPIVGTAAKLPWNEVLVIGTDRTVIPMTTRPLVSHAVAAVLAAPPAGDVEVVVLAAPNSPTRRTYAEACCRRFGIGTRVRSLPVPLWWLTAVGAEAALRVLGRGKLQPYSKLTSRLHKQRFDASASARRLGLDLTVDWEAELARSLDGQEPNYALPPAPPPLRPSRNEPGRPASAAGAVTFLGFGRIVRQKHLPGLKRAGFAGDVRAYDLAAGDGPDGVRVQPIAGATLAPADLIVVASPGPAHAAALPLLRPATGTVLVEKPLCFNPDELREWAAFAAGRTAPVVVCHNYRFKQNVRRMLDHLARFNPGRLHHATLEFQSPGVTNDSAAWLRDERRARTLLMDYSIHFLDVACLLGRDPWAVVDVRHDLDGHGHTRRIAGRLAGSYAVDFTLAQGYGPRRCRVRFQFQNYVASLGFFPDTFAAQMADDNPWYHKAEARDSRRQTVRKVADKLTGRDSDRSHALLLAAALRAESDPAAAAAVMPVTVPALAGFYEMLFEVAGRVYGP